jgi:hypothetical protein
VVVFPDQVLDPVTQQDQPGIHPRTGTISLGDLTAPQILDGRADVFAAPFNDAANPGASVLSQFVSGMFHYSVSGVTDFAYYADPLAGRTYRYESPQPQPYLRGADNRWYLPGGAASCAPDISWETKESGTVVATDCAPSPPAPSFFLPYRDTFYPAGLTLDKRRTLLDPSPPAAAGSRLAAYFLPACSDFLVEYTYDDPREVIATSPTDATPVETVPVRWWSVPNGEQWVWSRLSVDPPARTDGRERTERYRWPRAIRINMRLYDPAARLERPVEHSLIWTWE